MMDELRDYRFYKEDLIHPSQTAVDYIFKKLINSLFTDNSVSTIQEVQQFRQFKMHKAKDQKLHQQQIEQKKKSYLKNILI